MRERLRGLTGGGRGGIGRTAALVMAAIAFSKATGFVRSSLITNVFADGSQSDPLFMALTFTNAIYNLVLSGAIASALIPFLSGSVAKGEEREGWKAVSSFLNATFAFVFALGVLGAAFAPAIVEAVAYGFDAELKATAVSTMRILLPSVSFIMLAGFINGVLNSYGRFGAAAFGPSIYNLLCIGSIAAFHGGGVVRVAWGIAGSSVIYCAAQLAFARKEFRGYSFAADLASAGTRRIFALALPALVASVAIQANTVISQAYSSAYDAGSVTSFNNANELWQLPYGIFASGVGTAIFPVISGRYAKGDIGGYRDLLTKGLKAVWMFTLPSVAVLAVCGPQIVAIAFKWSPGVDPHVAYGALLGFCLALFCQASMSILIRGFYSSLDTRTPLYVGLAAIAANVAANVAIGALMPSLKVAGTAAAFSFACLVNTALLYLALRRKGLGVHPEGFAAFTAKLVVASALAAAAMLALNPLIGYDTAGTVAVGGRLVEAACLAAQVLLGGAVFLASCRVMGVDMVKGLLGKARKALSR
ncbi:MAG: murein biosynthesis integral membrane protein MurJ [Oscillospiraceae bacterium]|nr:murein biosynthesis integral membrane protein MurJ [Oscillospiraceae bacterium]